MTRRHCPWCGVEATPGETCICGRLIPRWGPKRREDRSTIRSERIVFRVTAGEKEAIAETAALMEITISDAVRWRVLTWVESAE